MNKPFFIPTADGANLINSSWIVYADPKQTVIAHIGPVYRVFIGFGSGVPEYISPATYADLIQNSGIQL